MVFQWHCDEFYEIVSKDGCTQITFLYVFSSQAFLKGNFYPVCYLYGVM